MSSFDFKKMIKENIYHSKYPHVDKTNIIINEGQTVLIETEIHEGIMDMLRGYTKKQPGYKKAMEDEIDKYLAKSSLNDERKQIMKSYYMKNFYLLPDGEIDQESASDIEDSLEAAAKGDIDTATKEMSSAVDAADNDKTQKIASPTNNTEKEFVLAKRTEPDISAALLDITDATSEKWEKIRKRTTNKKLQQAMDYIYNLSLAEQKSRKA